MTLRISIVASVVALALLIVILELIRSRRLQERYAILWLVTGTAILVLSVWRSGSRIRRRPSSSSDRSSS
jgi:ABC-type nickel/cobalt efflux system permease component RcnA